MHRQHPAALVTLCLVLLAGPAPAQEPEAVPRGMPGPAVVARSQEFGALPTLAPGLGGPPLSRGRRKIDPVAERVRAIKASGIGVPAAELPHLTLDPAGIVAMMPDAAQAPTPGVGFEGITQQGYIPSEPTVAAGPLNVFSAGNVSVTVTDKNGANRVEVNGAAFFGAPPSEGPITDAVCSYDALRGRFVALCFTHGSTPNFSYFYLAISKTNDARGAWWLYKFDQTLDGAVPTSNWSDYGGLGWSDDKLAMSSQQYAFATDSYVYQKIRVIDRAAAYAGGPVTFVDIANFLGPPGGTIDDRFVTKVGRNLSAGDATIHALNVRVPGGSRVTYRTLTGPPTAPSLSIGNTVPVSAYTVPPDAKQLGTMTVVATNDCALGEFYVRNGVLIAAWNTGVSLTGGTVSGVRLFRMRTSDRAVLTDETFAAPGIYYYYPAATVDSVGTVFLGFDRSSATEYTSAWATGKRRSDATLQPSVLLKSGVSATNQTRWGDYTGIDMDESATGPSGARAWYAGQWAKATSNFGTWIGQLTFTYGVIAGTLLDDCDGNTGTAGDRTPAAGVTVTLQRADTTLAVTTSDGTGAYSFGYLESGTYDVLVTPPGGGIAVDALPGMGGTTQMKLSADELRVGLTDAQNSSGNGFLLGLAESAPVATGIVPAVKSVGAAAFPLTVDGSGFVPCAVVRVDGTPRATTFVNAGQLTAAIPASDLSTPGLRVVTVLNPAPGVVSNPETLRVRDVTLPTATLVAPNGGETWKVGSQHWVTWSASDNGGVAGLDLAYSTDGGATFPHVIATGVPNTGPFLWTVPATPTGTARLRITARDDWDNTASDASDANFTIDVGPTAQVVAPNGGGSFEVGTSTNLQWTATDDQGVTGVDLMLSRTGAGGAYETLVLGTGNSGSWAWTVTGPVTSAAFLKVVAHDAQGNTAVDTSDAAFAIVHTVASEHAPVVALELSPVAPNPVQDRGRIAFALPRPALVRLSIVDAQGREIAVVARGPFPAGRHAFTWEGATSRGPAAPGLYFVRLETPERTLVRRLALVR